MLSPLTAITPLDGRYREKLKQLESYFSEYALIRYRVFVELEWFIFLCNEVKLPETRLLTEEELKMIRDISTSFDGGDATRVKELEKTTNHDVKAVEYFIKEHFKGHPKLAELSEFLHFGCTSEDINTLSYSLILKDFLTKEFRPLLSGVIMKLYEVAQLYAEVPMLSRTHGQPASPTTIGKEIINVVARLESQYHTLSAITLPGKFSGAVGNFNAHCVAYPELAWDGIATRFISYMGLKPNLYTTQIEPHDIHAEIFHTLVRINTILIDYARDTWTYISLGYFKQKLKEGEVGSSTMPHKVNPIDFENAEGNLGLSSAVAAHLAEKLPISRMQRDLSDSTVMRNCGVAFGYTVLAIKSLLTGVGKLIVNTHRLEEDLNANWEVLTEPIQTVLRKYKVAGAYEQLKELSRGKQLSHEILKEFIDTLEIPVPEKKRLIHLTPATYCGLAAKLVQEYKLSTF